MVATSLVIICCMGNGLLILMVMNRAEMKFTQPMLALYHIGIIIHSFLRPFTAMPLMWVMVLCIAHSNSHPKLPERLSADAQDFLRLAFTL